MLRPDLSYRRTGNTPPPDLERTLRAIATATQTYLRDHRTPPTSIDDLRLADDSVLDRIIYSPELLGGAGIVLAYCDIEESEDVAVLYFFPNRVVVLSKAELDTELARMRKDAAAKRERQED